MQVTQGAIFVAGLLQPLWPLGPTVAATRNQYFLPLVSPPLVACDLVATAACAQAVAVGGFIAPLDDVAAGLNRNL